MNCCEYDFFPHYVHYRKQCIRRSYLNKKIYLGRTWITHFFLLTQFAPLPIFKQFLHLSDRKITSENHTILHALCASRNSDHARTFECIKFVVNIFGRLTINAMDDYGHTCIYYLNGPFLDFFMKRGAICVIEAARYGCQYFRGQFYLPECADGVIDILVEQRNVELIRLAISNLPQRIDLCFKMALVFDHENEHEWLEKALDFGATLLRQFDDDWKDEFLTRHFGVASSEREQFLFRRITENNSVLHLTKYMDMLLEHPGNTYDYAVFINWNFVIPCLEEKQIKHYKDCFVKKMSEMAFKFKMCILTSLLFHHDENIEHIVQLRDKENFTVLHTICKQVPYWPPSFLEKCLKAGANVNVKTSDGHTPFHFLLFKDRMDWCQILVRYNAHADIRFMCDHHKQSMQPIYNSLKIVLSLKCLATSTVLDFKLSYNLLPQKLIDFVNFHKTSCTCLRYSH